MAQDDAERLNGLMGAMGRKEQENKMLRDQLAQLTAQEPTGGLAAGWQPGTRLEVNADGELVEYDQPAPQNPNQSNYLGRGADPTATKGDDGSPEWAKAELYRQLGYQPDRNPFSS